MRACVRACVRAGACAFRKNGACVRASRLCKPKSYPLLVSGTLSNNGLNLMLEATIDMFMGFLIFPAADSVPNLCVHACYSLMSRGTFVFPYMCAVLCVCVCVCARARTCSWLCMRVHTTNVKARA